MSPSTGENSMKTKPATMAELTEGTRIRVTSPMGKKACGIIIRKLSLGATFRACKFPIEDMVTSDNIHLVEIVEGECC